MEKRPTFRPIYLKYNLIINFYRTNSTKKGLFSKKIIWKNEKLFMGISCFWAPNNLDLCLHKHNCSIIYYSVMKHISLLTPCNN